jgi:putative ABC transport system permease protein
MSGTRPVLALLLARFTLRHAQLAPRQTAALVAIVALGVAVFLAIRLANRAAVASFSHFTEALAGRSDWVLQPPAGTLPETVLTELQAELADYPAHLLPVVETTAAAPAPENAAPGFGRPAYTVLGLDLIALANLAQAGGPGARLLGGDAAGADRAGSDAVGFWNRFRAGPQLWVSPDLAPPAGQPAVLELLIHERTHRLPVAGVIPAAAGGVAPPPGLIVVDLPELQRLTGRPGQLDRVEVIVAPGPRRAERQAEVGALLTRLAGTEPRWEVTTPGARRETAAEMTRAFRYNLTVLSLLALLVGLYLIFQALDGAVVRRRAETAVLRSLGVEEAVIRRAWLIEAAVLGAAGGILGVALGWAGAQIAVRAVGQTVNALYYATSVSSARPDAADVLLGLALGLGASVVAGWGPARAAARIPPAQALARHAPPAEGGWSRQPRIGLGLLAIAGVCATLPPVPLAGGGAFPLGGHAAALLGLFGAGLLAGPVLGGLARLARAGGRLHPAARVALGHLARPSGRHRLAAAALLAATAMTAGMAILVGSFERTVEDWIQRTLRADLYLSSAGAQSASTRNRITPETWRALAAHPAVEAAAIVAAHAVRIGGVPTTVSGTDLALLRRRADLPWLLAPRDEAPFDAARNAGLALVSESFAARFHVGPGESVRLPTPAGPKTLTVAGVFADYGNERGSLLVERAHLAAWFGDEQAASVSLFLRPGADPSGVRAELLRRHPGLGIYTNGALREEILRIFRNTFAVTHALEVIGVAVAVAGLALTLASVLLDRRDELTTLRALGFTPGELALATALEGAGLALVATLAGLAVSLGLGWLLIHVINRQSFGWTLGFVVPWGQLALLAAGIVAAGALASHALGRWGARLPADLHE